MRGLVELGAQLAAGSDLADAVRCVREANAEGKHATIDVLGEHTTSAEKARRMARAYEDVFDAIEREQLDSNVSVKPTGFGLRTGSFEVSSNTSDSPQSVNLTGSGCRPFDATREQMTAVGLSRKTDCRMAVRSATPAVAAIVAGP